MAEKRRALGRGLGALIPSAPPGAARPVDVFFPSGSDRPDDPSASGDLTASLPDPTDSADLAAVPGAAFAELPITSISPNPRQPRTVFDEDELAELVHSITEIGVLQPVVVRRSARGDDAGPAYELIMGERRLRASKIAGLTAIPAIIKDTQDDAMLRDALLENLHRSQLNPLEEAAAYRQLLDDFGCTQDELAGRIGRSRPQVTNTLRLLRLPPLVARRVAAGVLSAGHARALLGLEGEQRAVPLMVARGDRRARGLRECSRSGPQAPAARVTPPAAGRRQRRPRGPARHPSAHQPGSAQRQADRRVRVL